MPALIIPIYPARRAVQALSDIGRVDLRRQAVQLVVSEVRAGNDGLHVARMIASHRRQQVTQGGAA